MCNTLNKFIFSSSFIAQYAKDLVKIADKDLPILIIYAKDDAIIEATSTEEKIRFLHIPEENVKNYDGDWKSEYTFQGKYWGEKIMAGILEG